MQKNQHTEKYEWVEKKV